MREILFRGQAKAGYKWTADGEWIEGSLFYSDNENGTVCQIATSYLSASKKEHVMVVAYDVDPETVCQYTGLTDKNGRKIFEGDIVRDIFNASVVGIVRYGEYRNTFNDDEHGGHVGFYVEWKEKRDLLRKDLVYWVKNSEFIGNTFDNPELIGEWP